MSSALESVLLRYGLALASFALILLPVLGRRTANLPMETAQVDN